MAGWGKQGWGDTRWGIGDADGIGDIKVSDALENEIAIPDALEYSITISDEGEQ